jgi:hypothetical protein
VGIPGVSLHTIASKKPNIPISFLFAGNQRSIPLGITYRVNSVPLSGLSQRNLNNDLRPSA